MATLQEFEERFQNVTGSNATLGEVIAHLGHDVATVRAAVLKVLERLFTNHGLDDGLSDVEKQEVFEILHGAIERMGVTAVKLGQAGVALKVAGESPEPTKGKFLPEPTKGKAEPATDKEVNGRKRLFRRNK